MMDWSGWALYGLVATTVLTSVMMSAQMTGISRMDLPLLLGTIFTPRPDRAHLVGAGVHMINGQAFALLYAAAFAQMGHAGWALGAGFGLVHGAAALTVIVPLLPGVHPRMASERAGPGLPMLEPPGWIALNYGRSTPVVTLLAHAMYGAILGGFLGPR